MIRKVSTMGFNSMELGGSASNLTNELFLDENLVYVMCWGLALLARPEEHTRTKIFKIFGLPI